MCLCAKPIGGCSTASEHHPQQGTRSGRAPQASAWLQVKEATDQLDSIAAGESAEAERKAKAERARDKAEKARVAGIIAAQEEKRMLEAAEQAERKAATDAKWKAMDMERQQSMKLLRQKSMRASSVLGGGGERVVYEWRQTRQSLEPGFTRREQPKLGMDFTAIEKQWAGAAPARPASGALTLDVNKAQDDWAKACPCPPAPAPWRAPQPPRHPLTAQRPSPTSPPHPPPTVLPTTYPTVLSYRSASVS